MHFVSKIEEAAAPTPPLYARHSSGFRRATYVDQRVGSVHMGVGICFLDSQGAISPHVHSFEESFYILEGEPVVRIGEASYQLSAGHFDEAQLPRPGGPSQMEGFNPTTGVAIKMFVDRSFGAIHQSLFLIQYLPGAKIDLHDHTFEESYLIVSGRVRAQADGKSYDLGPGDVIWTSVGCLHSFDNAGTEPVRWIETQAPLPPAKEVFRFEREWAPLAEKEKTASRA